MVTATPITAKTPTLLFVDDERNQRLLCEDEFVSEGYDVVTASNGREALDLIDRKKPDLVVLDIRMPGMDGIETFGKLFGKDRSIPVILYTAYGQYRDNFMTWAADEYLVKSSDLSELKDKVREVLSRRRRGQRGAAREAVSATGVR